MAIFVAKAIAGGAANIPVSGTVGGAPYNCVAGGTSIYLDVAPTDTFCKHVHYLAAQNVTLGMRHEPLLPERPRVAASRWPPFIAKGIVAPAGGPGVPLTYGPDPNTGLSYSCNTGSPNIHFLDVPATDHFCKHAHYLWAKGVIAGCTGDRVLPQRRRRPRRDGEVPEQRIRPRPSTGLKNHAGLTPRRGSDKLDGLRRRRRCGADARGERSRFCSGRRALFGQSPPLFPEFPVNSVTSGNQRRSSVAIDDAGNFIVVWQNPADPYFRNFDPSAVAGSAESSVAVTGFQSHPRVARNASGASVVVFSRARRRLLHRHFRPPLRHGRPRRAAAFPREHLHDGVSAGAERRDFAVGEFRRRLGELSESGRGGLGHLRPAIRQRGNPARLRIPDQLLHDERPEEPERGDGRVRADSSSSGRATSRTADGYGIIGRQFDASGSAARLRVHRQLVHAGRAIPPARRVRRRGRLRRDLGDAGHRRIGLRHRRTALRQLRDAHDGRVPRQHLHVQRPGIPRRRDGLRGQLPRRLAERHGRRSRGARLRNLCEAVRPERAAGRRRVPRQHVHDGRSDVSLGRARRPRAFRRHLAEQPAGRLRLRNLRAARRISAGRGAARGRARRRRNGLERERRPRARGARVGRAVLEEHRQDRSDV